MMNTHLCLVIGTAPEHHLRTTIGRLRQTWPEARFILALQANRRIGEDSCGADSVERVLPPGLLSLAGISLRLFKDLRSVNADKVVVASNNPTGEGYLLWEALAVLSSSGSAMEMHFLGEPRPLSVKAILGQAAGRLAAPLFDTGMAALTFAAFPFLALVSFFRRMAGDKDRRISGDKE